jgi:hypothetical protein
MPNETYDWEAAAERLREQADRGYPEPWLPESDGEELLGTVVAIREAAPTKFGPCPVVEIQGVGGQAFSVWLNHTVLRRAFERNNVQPGELVLIRYVGRRTPEGGGNDYADYRLVVDRPIGKTADWRGIAERYGDDVDDDLKRAVPAPPFDPSEADDIPF